MPVTPEASLTPRARRAFALAKHSAAQVLRRRLRLLHLARDAYDKLERDDDVLARVRDDLITMLRLVTAWARKDYRRVPWRTLLYVTAALVYFVNPVDLIPDALVGLGLVDDVAVVGAVVRAIHRDLDAFRAWRGEAATVSTAPAVRATAET